MKMHNPPHPGEVIKGLWLDPANITITTASQALGVSRKTLSKIVNGHGSITSEMAVRLSITFGGSPESWMRHQATYDICQVEQHRDTIHAESLKDQLIFA